MNTGWQNGWWQAAQPCPSPNFGPRPANAQVDLVVVHSISLPPGQYGGEHVLRFFRNELDTQAHPYFAQLQGLQVSAHFFITRTGLVWQCVSADDRAWHAGVSRYRGRDNCNDDSIGIELEGLEGEPFETAQYTALSRVCQALAQHYPIAHVAGHEHIAPGRKGDPGAGFDWAFLRTQLAWDPRCFP